MAGACLLIILDGLGDRGYPEFGGKTPLDAAHTPHLDRLAALGANGLFHATRPGKPLPSENAHFALFGYGKKEFPGRGILEALGAGMPVDAEDVAFLAHLVSVEERDRCLFLVKDRPEALEEEIEAVLATLPSISMDGIDVAYHRTKGLDGITLARGGASPGVTDSDPLIEGMPVIRVEPLDRYRDDPAAVTTARAMTRFHVSCYKALKNHPVNLDRERKGFLPLNAVVVQRPGRLRAVTPFVQRWGLPAVSISSGMIYWGIASFLGMDVFRSRETVDPGADLAERIRTALGLLDRYRFIHVHSKAPDAAGHTKKPAYKKEVIECLDRGLGTILDEILAVPDLLVILTSDHSTPSSGPLIHSGEPVPFAMAGKNCRMDRVVRFSEVDAACGALGCLRGADVMPLVLDAIDFSKLSGLMDTPHDQAFWPGWRSPLMIGAVEGTD